MLNKCSLGEDKIKTDTYTYIYIYIYIYVCVYICTLVKNFGSVLCIYSYKYIHKQNNLNMICTCPFGCYNQQHILWNLCDSVEFSLYFSKFFFLLFEFKLLTICVCGHFHYSWNVLWKYIQNVSRSWFDSHLWLQSWKWLVVGSSGRADGGRCGWCSDLLPDDWAASPWAWEEPWRRQQHQR